MCGGQPPDQVTRSGGGGAAAAARLARPRRAAAALDAHAAQVAARARRLHRQAARRHVPRQLHHRQRRAHRRERLAAQNPLGFFRERRVRFRAYFGGLGLLRPGPHAQPGGLSTADWARAVQTLRRVKDGPPCAQQPGRWRNTAAPAAATGRAAPAARGLRSGPAPPCAAGLECQDAHNAARSRAQHVP
jgi:hypothetical protein